MEATNPSNHTLGSVSYPSSTLERYALSQEGTNPIGLQNHTHGLSGATTSIPPLPHEPVDGESNDEYAEQESIGPVAEDWNEATLTAVSPRLRSEDFFHDLDYDPDSQNLEDSHHYSCECSLCEAANYEANIDEAQVFESLMTSVSQYSEETGTSQVSDHPFAETAELQSANGPPFPTVYLPEVQQLSSRTEVLRFLERHDGGKATCLWINEGGECGFLSQIDLVKRHIKRVHFRLRPCACEYCGRRFFNSYALSLHYNYHTGAKPFACKFCGMGFSSPSGRSHHHVHTHGYRVRPVLTTDSFSGEGAGYVNM